MGISPLRSWRALEDRRSASGVVDEPEVFIGKARFLMLSA